MKKTLPLTCITALILATLAAATVEAADVISKTQTTGPYTVTLKVLPAESFSGANPAMAWDGGAKAMAEDATPQPPNHHMVVFVKKDGEPVADATVTIRYRRIGAKDSQWRTLPVARMHEAGQGEATEHYGNNVWLVHGDYQAEVTVNGSEPVPFEFILPVGS
jgi:hypothetical protein